MTMPRYVRPVNTAGFIDPIPAAVMKAKTMHLDDPNHAHYCVVQNRGVVQVLRHADTSWRVLYSTRNEEEKKTFFKRKYH